MPPSADPAADPPVVATRREGALWIRLNRPAALNALIPETVRLINAALSEAEHDDDIRAVILTGIGKAFCSGADLRYIRNEIGDDRAAMSAFLNSVLAMMLRLESFPRPVIAAVNGTAVAGGLELLLCCDLVIAARSAKIGDGHGNFGLLPGGGATARLPRKVGVTFAKYMLFTAELLPAERLVAPGLINEVVDDDGLEAAAAALAAKLATKSPLVLRRVKALVDDGLDQPLQTALRAELLAGEAHAGSHDMQEGIAAFDEKRPPRFTGR